MPIIEYERTNTPDTLAIRVIKSVVLNAFCVDENDVFEKTRKADIVIVRQLIAYFYYQYTRLTFRAIADIIGKRDHATVMHSVVTISSNIEVDVIFRTKVGGLSKEIENRLMINKRKRYYKSSNSTNMTSKMANAVARRLNGRRRDKDIMDAFDIDLESMYNIKWDARKEDIVVTTEDVLLDKILNNG